jgi:hypothetical protein
MVAGRRAMQLLEQLQADLERRMPCCAFFDTRFTLAARKPAHAKSARLTTCFASLIINTCISLLCKFKRLEEASTKVEERT